jgi:hypothetical protein
MNPRVRFGRIDIGAVEGCYRKPGVVIVFR